MSAERGPSILSQSFRHALLLSLVLPVAVVALGLWNATPESPPKADSEHTQNALKRVKDGATYQRLKTFQTRFPERWPGAKHEFLAEQTHGLELRRVDGLRSELTTLGLHDVIATAGNVYGKIPGRDPSCAVLLAAHHDTLMNAPGAIDNGGSVAVLLEVASLLITSSPPPACDIDVVFFDREELGLLGSKAYVNALDDAGRSRLKAVLALELLGWHRDALVVHTLPRGFAWTAKGITPAWIPEAVLNAGKHAEVPVGLGDPWLSIGYQALVRELSLGTGSDAGAFLEAGIPAAMLSGSSLTRFYDAYHTPQDDLSHVSSPRLTLATRVTLAASLELARKSATEVTSDLGEAYLMIGQRTLSATWLTAFGLATCAVLLLAMVLLVLCRRWWAGLAFGLPLGGMLVISLTPNVLGLLVGAPIVIGLALVLVPERRPWPVLLAGHLPLALALVMVGAALVAFGATWEGVWMETLALLWLPPSSAFAAMIYTRRSRKGLHLYQPHNAMRSTFRKSKSPVLRATRHFQTRDKGAAVAEGRSLFRLWYHGTGVAPTEHPAHEVGPLTSHLSGMRCGYCKSKDVLVRTLSWSVSLNTGDFHFDFETQCKDCSGYTAVSYSED